MPKPTGSTFHGDHWSTAGPPTPILATSFLLAGLGTVVLGPLLPQLLHDWRLTDQRGGLLLLAKFVGGLLRRRRHSSPSPPRHPRRSRPRRRRFRHLRPRPRPHPGPPGPLPDRPRPREIIASTNILAGRLWPTHAGSALSLLNFFWSLGAVSTGLLLAALLSRVGWQRPILALALLYALTGALTRLSTKPPSSTSVISTEAAQPRGGETRAFDVAGTEGTSPPTTLVAITFPTRLSLTYATLLFLYGGLETCLTAWLTTFSLRFAGGHLLGGQSGFVVLWAALTLGRVLASALMRRFPERLVQRLSLALCLLLIVFLATTHTAASLSLACILLGLALAPVFPSTFALLLRHAPQPRVAGTLLAVSGLGAALFPSLMGVVSTHTGSLRLAMAVPALLVPLMLLATMVDSQNGTTFPPRA